MMNQKKQILESLKSVEKWLKESNLDLFNWSSKIIRHVEEYFPEDKVTKKKNSSKSVNFANSDDFPIPEYCQTRNDYAIFSDGACRGNPGPGAWSCVAQDFEGEVIYQAASFDEKTTNNRMELSGSLEGMKQFLEYAKEFHLPLHQVKLFVVSDSRYVVDGMTSWVKGWKARGWKKADNKVPENVELWKELDSVRSQIVNVEFKWVKGHADHPQNEYCDRMCNELLDRELGGEKGAEGGGRSGNHGTVH
ncbi:MAG: ribonuclease HI [Bacteriovoracaceae bacterium]|nr:ribonuclease HI [Bacteriovoracaceae bacterium]